MGSTLEWRWQETEPVNSETDRKGLPSLNERKSRVKTHMRSLGDLQHRPKHRSSASQEEGRQEVQLKENLKK